MGLMVEWVRTGNWGPLNGANAGLVYETAEWLHDRQVAAIAGDAVEKVESMTLGELYSPFHMLVLRDMGMCIGEYWFLEDLAADCAEDRCLRDDARGLPAPGDRRRRITAQSHRHQVAPRPARAPVLDPRAEVSNLRSMDELTRLALAAAAGDRVALDRFVRATQADVWRLCAHLGDRDRADDLTQETYLRAFRSLPGFPGRVRRPHLAAEHRPAGGGRCPSHGDAPATAAEHCSRIPSPTPGAAGKT